MLNLIFYLCKRLITVMMKQPYDYSFLTGSRLLCDDPEWWKSHLGEYLYIYCEEGEARLMLLSGEHVLRKGGMVIVSPDMFPSQVAASADCRIFYCVFDAGLADKSTYNVPKEFFDCMYAQPVMPAFEGLPGWVEQLRSIGEDTQNPYREAIVTDLLHAFTLTYLHQWKKHFGETPQHYERGSTDRLCITFYNLMLEHYREHRDIAFYAALLCITPNYLAMILRRQCGETPKEAIDRQVMLGLKYELLNTEKTVTQLAREFHFPDISYLCRYFRRHTGMSLTEYRLGE